MVDSLKRFDVVRVVVLFRFPRRVSATRVVVVVVVDVVDVDVDVDVDVVDVDVDDDVRLVAFPRKTNLQPFSPSLL